MLGLSSSVSHCTHTHTHTHTHIHIHTPEVVEQGQARGVGQTFVLEGAFLLVTGHRVVVEGRARSKLLVRYRVPVRKGWVKTIITMTMTIAAAAAITTTTTTMIRIIMHDEARTVPHCLI